MRRVALTSCRIVARLNSIEEVDVTGGFNPQAQSVASVASLAATASSEGKRCCAASTQTGFRVHVLRAITPRSTHLRARHCLRGLITPWRLCMLHALCCSTDHGVIAARDPAKFPPKDAVNLVYSHVFGFGKCQTREREKSAAQFIGRMRENGLH